MKFLELAAICFERKVYFVLLLVAVFSDCNGMPQTQVCLIQSYFRSVQGRGTAGSGNLLRVNFQANKTFTPIDLSFTGTCNDSANKTKFIMLKKDINGLLIVSFFWEADRNYAVTIKNGTLQIEHVNRLQHYHEFIFKCATSACTLKTLESVSSRSPSYVKSDRNGQPLVGRNPSDVATWIKVLGTRVCYN